MSEKYTEEEIAQRIEATAQRREEKRKLDQFTRNKDKHILQSLHDKRSKHHFVSRGSVTLDIVGTLGKTEDWQVFWTIRSPNDRHSFRIAKKNLGYFYYGNNIRHQFDLCTDPKIDEVDLQLAALFYLQYMVFAKVIDLPKWIREEIYGWNWEI